MYKSFIDQTLYHFEDLAVSMFPKKDFQASLNLPGIKLTPTPSIQAAHGTITGGHFLPLSEELAS